MVFLVEVLPGDLRFLQHLDKNQTIIDAVSDHVEYILKVLLDGVGGVGESENDHGDSFQKK